jgi:hypothetical protein
MDVWPHPTMTPVYRERGAQALAVPTPWCRLDLRVICARHRVGPAVRSEEV